MRPLPALIATAAAAISAFQATPAPAHPTGAGSGSAPAAAVASARPATPAGGSSRAGLAERGELAADLAGAISATGWQGDEWGVLVVSLDGGDTLFAHHAEAPLIPASNLKLFTTAAALEYLGPGYRYATYLTATGPVRDGVLKGDLVVYGTGDPTISARFFESKTTVLEALADSLAALGVRRIAGDVVGDASYFQGAGVGEGWQTAYVTHTYAARASALSFNDNIITLRVRPGPAPASPPEILLIPGGRVQMVVEATTVASGRTNILVQRDGYDAPIRVTGGIRTGDPGVWRAVPVVSPPAFAASVLAEVLAERGIEVTGSIRAVESEAASAVTGRRVFAPALEQESLVQVLAVHRSPPLLEILEVINQRSHNLYADVVLRTVGRVATGTGSVEGGARAVTALLKQASPDDPRLHMDDGSGLSVLDRASAGTIVRLLTHMANESPHRDAFLKTLPEAATSRGLRRMQQTPAAGNLRAKTGTIDGVSALSGYVTARNGERLAFSIISNNVPSTWRAKRIEDRIGARLASFDRAVPHSGRLAAGEGARGAEDSLPTQTEAPASETPSAPADRPGQLAATDTARAAPSTYTIRPGDTLDGIARRNGTTVSALQEANPGVNPRRLMPGRTLRLPGS